MYDTKNVNQVFKKLKIILSAASESLVKYISTHRISERIKQIKVHFSAGIIFSQKQLPSTEQDDFDITQPNVK